MNAALYYPHTELNDASLMKTSLLLWDEVKYIAPYAGYKPKYRNKFMRNAAEVLLRPHDISQEDRERAAASIMAMANNPLPDWLITDKPASQDDYNQYLMYRSKFGDELVYNLKGLNLANDYRGDPQDFSTHSSFGLIMMGALAQHCAGSTRALITDRLEIYDARARYATFLSGGRWISPSSGVRDLRQAESVLVTLSLKALSPRKFTIKELVKMREKEGGEGARLRRRYADFIRRYTSDLAQVDGRDRRDVEEGFERDVGTIIGELEEKLDRRLGKTALSREMFITAAVLMASDIRLVANTEPWIAGFIGMGMLSQAAYSYFSDRKDIINGSDMGYFFRTKGFL